MKPNKFRAWYNKENRWINETIHLDSDGYIYVYNPDGSYNYNIDCLQIIISWAIGLSDTMGIEIFEGDIIETEHNRIKAVSWSNEEACFILDDKRHEAFYHFSNVTGKIVGNVYENGGLL